VEHLRSLIRLVLLTVDGQTYAPHLEAMDRILRMVEITPLPGAPYRPGLPLLSNDAEYCFRTMRRTEM
jgi:hypothetical protein